VESILGDIVLQTQTFGTFLIFWSKHDICITRKYVHDVTYTRIEYYRFPLEFDLMTFRIWDYREYQWAILYVLTQIPHLALMNLGYICQQWIIDQNDSFRYFRLLMSTWRDSVCENTFETSHVRFIHENFSVLIAAPLDQIQQNLLRKETWQTTAKSADIVWQTWFEEYPTPP